MGIDSCAGSNAALLYKWLCIDVMLKCYPAPALGVFGVTTCAGVVPHLMKGCGWGVRLHDAVRGRVQVVPCLVAGVRV